MEKITINNANKRKQKEGILLKKKKDESSPTRLNKPK